MNKGRGAAALNRKKVENNISCERLVFVYGYWREEVHLKNSEHLK